MRSDVWSWNLGGREGRGGETFSFLDARCKTGCTIEKNTCWLSLGPLGVVHSLPGGLPLPRPPPCSWRGSRPTDSHGWGAAAPPSQHVFLFDRAFGWEGLPGVPEGPPSLKQIVNTGQSSAIVTPGRSPCDRAPCRPNCFGRSANDTGRIPKWSATVWVQPPAGDLGGGSPPTRGVWGAGAPPEYRKCSIGRNTATRTHTLK